MAWFACLHIEKLPEGLYLATSKDIPGLLVQAKTIAETIEIARDIAISIHDLQGELGYKKSKLNRLSNSFEYPLIFET